MSSSFASISHFALKLFSVPRYHWLLLYSSPILIDLEKKVTTRMEILTCVGCLIGILMSVLTYVCLSKTFSNGRDMIEL